MSKIVFRVQGSKSNPYTVTFENMGGNVKALCDCAAGKNGQACKHRSRILSGDSTDIVSSNVNEVAIVSSWSEGGQVEKLQTEIQLKEAQLSKLEKEISQLRKKISKAMSGAA